MEVVQGSHRSVVGLRSLLASGQNLRTCAAGSSIFHRPPRMFRIGFAIFVTRVLAIALVAELCVAMGAPAAPPNPPLSQMPESHSVWEGVYTQKQAERGEALYGRQCASCHGDRLTGNEKELAPPLTGREFEAVWSGYTIYDLYRKILRKMPEDNPGQLTPQQGADLVAFLLSFNRFPAGKIELPPQDKLLAAIRFDAKRSTPQTASPSP